jgi:hypothetical protein
MKKFLSIITWYLVFISVPFLFWITGKAGIATPTRLKHGAFVCEKVPQTGQYLIGDCNALNHPSDLPRLGKSQATIEELFQLLHTIPCDTPETTTVTFILLCGGADIWIENESWETIDSQLVYLLRAIHQRFPKSSVLAPSPKYIRAVALDHGKDEWHLNEQGYAILLAKKD